MGAHEKECALAAYALLIERADTPAKRRHLRREYQRILKAPVERAS